MKIAALALIQNNEGQILGLQCSKGRGIMVPGGKFEAGTDLTYRHCAARELEEETGVTVSVNSYKLIHDGLNANVKTYLYCYYFDVYDDTTMKNTKEGKPIWIYPSYIVDQDNLYTPVFEVIFDKLDFYLRSEGKQWNMFG